MITTFKKYVFHTCAPRYTCDTPLQTLGQAAPFQIHKEPLLGSPQQVNMEEGVFLSSWKNNSKVTLRKKLFSFFVVLGINPGTQAC
jgi:hypothetical protein